jgi:TetR/AcrR family transcriptional regulator, transcriptional repressor of bet genes
MTKKITARKAPVKRGRGRPPVGDERRAEIAAALGDVMGKTGYAKATVAAVARAAGVSPGLLHYHFADKRQILVTLVERLVAGVDARFRGLAANVDDPRAKLDAFVDAYVGLGPGADARAVAAWVAIGAEALRDAEVRAIYRDSVATTLARARELVGACLASERRSTRHANEIAAAIVAAVEGAYRVTAAAPGVLPKGFAAPMLRRTIDGLLAAEPRA